MTTAQPTSVKTSSPSRIAAAACVGTTIEWYDFFIFSTAAALVFNEVFFPAVAPLRGTLLAFVTFGVGFVARPVGALFFGHFGDKRGRRNILVVTLLMMGLATFAIGLMPTYGQVGVIAPILLVVSRLIQGFAVGGEWGGATLMAVEHASPRKKALLGSFVPLGSPLGLLLATAVFLLVQLLPAQAITGWGWRIPFLISILLVPIGLLIRAKITETPEFEEASRTERTRKAPAVQVVRGNLRQLLVGIGAFTGNFAAYYLLTTFVLVYTTETLGLPDAVALPTNLVAAISQGTFIVVAAVASLRFSPRTIAWTASAALLVWAFPTYALVRTESPWALWTTAFIAMAFIGLSISVLASEVARMFPAEVRYTGVSLCYQMAGVFGGGLSPIIATYLLDIFGGSIWPVAGYASVIAIIMTGCCLLLPKRSAPYRMVVRRSVTDAH